MQKNSKTILITGASSGIGRETAIRLAKLGYKVFAGVRKKIDKNEIESINPNITGVYLDVTNSASIDKAFWFIIKHSDKLDVLINNAGIATAGPIEFIPIKKIKEQFDINVFGALNVTQKFFPFLKKGLIINISSLSSYGFFPYIAPYSASKRAMDILFNNLMIENKDNVKVVSVKPAVIKTPIWKKSINSALETYDNINENLKSKYNSDFKYMTNHAEQSSKNGLEAYAVANVIEKIIESKNPKPSYNVGISSVFADWFSKLPLSLINTVIKYKIKKMN